MCKRTIFWNILGRISYCFVNNSVLNLFHSSLGGNSLLLLWRIHVLINMFFLLQPLHKELYNMNADAFFIPSFIKAIRANTKESFRKIMSEPSPGVYTFAMLQLSFCELLLAEVSVSLSTAS